MKTNKIPLPYPVWLYAALWLVFLYTYSFIYSFKAEAPNNPILSTLYFVEFGVHETSHLVFGFLPPIFDAAAGSIGEVSFTLLVLYAALKYRSYFMAVFGSLWVMFSLNNAGRYMADAVDQKLPLVSFGEKAIHDWHFVFSQLHWLDASFAIGTAIQILGDAIGTLGLLFGLYLITEKVRGKAVYGWRPFQRGTASL